MSEFLRAINVALPDLSVQLEACPSDFREEILGDIAEQIRRRWPHAPEGEIAAAIAAIRSRASGRGNRSAGLS